MKLYRVILPVKNIEEAKTFYTNLLGINGKRVSAGRHYFNCGGTILACYDSGADGDNFELPPNPEHLYFAVENLEEVFERAKKLNVKKIDKTIEMMPWGERCFYLTDPFGNQICFVDKETVFIG